MAKKQNRKVVVYNASMDVHFCKYVFTVDGHYHVDMMSMTIASAWPHTELKKKKKITNFFLINYYISMINYLVDASESHKIH